MKALFTRRKALALLGTAIPASAEFPDIRTITPDLTTPAVMDAPPGPGLRVRQTLPEYRGSGVHHALYLPVDWRKGKRYPVIVEYAGNGNYRNQYGDVSEGTVEGSNLGYGISAGRGFIWVCMPYVNPVEKRNQILWWGDADATVNYCTKAVAHVCRHYGGDRSAVILAGFSRGAIACNYIGLRTDEIARLWLAFIAYSQYDGVKQWPYPDCDRASARQRLERLRGRAQFIIEENSVERTREFLDWTGIRAPFILRALQFRNHNDAWSLRDIPERREVREWLKKVIAGRLLPRLQP